MITITPKLAGLLAASAVALMAPAAFASAGHTHANAATTWSFPSCSGVSPYDYVYSGDPCDVTADVTAAPAAAAASPAVASVPARNRVTVWRFPGCAEDVGYEYIFSGCEL